MIVKEHIKRTYEIFSCCSTMQQMVENKFVEIHPEDPKIIMLHFLSHEKVGWNPIICCPFCCTKLSFENEES